MPCLGTFGAPVSPGFCTELFATDCRPTIGGKVPNPPKKNWPWFHGLLFGMRIRVTATQYLRLVRWRRPQPEFRRQGADIGSRCIPAAIGGE